MGNEMEKKRNYAFDVLRILATVGIVFHHYQQVTNVYFENSILNYSRLCRESG